VHTQEATLIGELVYIREEMAVYSRNPGFTDTRLRPLARRRDNTAAPLLVFIRVRNPCFFERLRRFGWKVRLGMKNGCS